MTRRDLGLVLLGAACWLGTGRANAAEPATVTARAGDHPGFGRVVFDLPDGAVATTTREGDRVEVRFSAAAVAPGATGGAGLAARNLRASEPVPGGMELTVAHGARIKATRLGNRLVIDLADPAPAPAAARGHPAAASGPAPAAAPAAAALAAPSPAVPVAVERADLPATPASVPPPALAAPPAESPPAAPRPEPGPPLAAPAARAVLSLPFSMQTGAAAFQRGGSTYVVFDERRPIDLGAERDDPSFAGASVQLLPNATVLRLAADAAAGLMLEHKGASWTVAPGSPAIQPFSPALTDGGLLLPSTDAGHVVPVPDPLGGGTLLVGTLRQPGRAIAATRRSTDFILRTTLLGVLVEPILDSLEVHATPAGFLITAGVGRALALSDRFAPPAGAGVPEMSRSLDLPDLPREALFVRLQDAEREAAEAPARSRAEQRLRVAQSMLALGMGAEAQAVAGVAAADDPKAAEDPLLIETGAVGALLGGRPGESDGLLDAGLPPTDELAFLRAVRGTLSGDPAPNVVEALAAGWKLLASYPAPIRDRLLAPVAEALAAGGQQEAARGLTARFADDGRLDLARAMLMEDAARRGGDGDAALAALARLAGGPDRRMHAVAAEHAAELRLAKGLAAPLATADALEKLLYAWRDDRHEVALRERIASLRADGGLARPALALLRETAGLWPGEAARLHGRMAAILADAARPDAQPPPGSLDFVTLVEDNADLLPQGDAGAELASRLADRLAALDLPQRAAAALQKLAARAPPGPPKATLGARLATQQLARNDGQAALAALRSSDAPDLPPALWNEREMIRARAQEAVGDRAGALATLAALDDPTAAAPYARLLEQGGDWPAAARVLDPLLAGLPAAGKLNADQSKLVLQQAADIARAGDDAALERLRLRFTDRLSSPDLGHLLAMLSAPAVREVSDLARAGREVAMARQLPTALDALTPARPRATR